MRKVTVFYAWQSDTPQRFNRYLIRLALEVAARRISDDVSLGVTIAIDSDTLGVPGQPPITDTILKKIAACDVFAPDLTFVARTEGGKFTPNPNVMLEYGYALRARSHSTMMSIMNTAFGPAENLPFDMGHLRHPIQYYASPAAKNAERRAARKALCEKIEEALRLILTSAIAEAQADNLFPEASPVLPPAFYFEVTEPIADVGVFEKQEYYFSFERAMYLRIFPQYADQASVTLTDLCRLFESKAVCSMSTNIGGVVARNSHGPIILRPIGEHKLYSLTQAFESGEIWGVNGELFCRRSFTHATGQEEPVTVIPIVSFEQLYCIVLANYIRILTQRLNFHPPFVVECGAVGLHGTYLAAPAGGLFGNGNTIGPVMKKELKRRYMLEDVGEGGIKNLLRQYFTSFYDMVATARKDAMTPQFIAKYNLPPL